MITHSTPSFSKSKSFLSYELVQIAIAYTWRFNIVQPNVFVLKRVYKTFNVNKQMLHLISNNPLYTYNNNYVCKFIPYLKSMSWHILLLFSSNLQKYRFTRKRSASSSSIPSGNWSYTSLPSNGRNPANNQLLMTFGRTKLWLRVW